MQLASVPRKLRGHHDKLVMAAQAGPLTRALPLGVTVFAYPENLVKKRIIQYTTTIAKTRATAMLRQQHLPPNVSGNNQTLMRIKHYIATTILIISLSILAFLYINSEARKLPFKSNPRYELTAYFISHDPNYDSLFHVNCRLYATFDKNGFCKLIQKYEDKMIFNELSLNETNIKLMNKYFENAPDRQDLIHNQPPRIYDGPSLRLNCSIGSTTKTLYFIAVDGSIYNRVFEEIYSYTINTKHNNCKDTLALKEMRHKMSTSIRDEIEAEFKKATNYSWDILE